MPTAGSASKYEVAGGGDKVTVEVADGDKDDKGEKDAEGADTKKGDDKGEEGTPDEKKLKKSETNHYGGILDETEKEVTVVGPGACNAFLWKHRVCNPFATADPIFRRFLRAIFFGGQFWFIFCVSGLFVWNDVFVSENEDGVPMPLEGGFKFLIVLIIFVLSRFFLWMVEGLNRLDAVSFLMRGLVTFVTVITIGKSCYFNLKVFATMESFTA
ncbi:MAG: hypothetical protein COA94_08790 [Rickettsiales bacterium]|nr:MAG: hypothetical protein COA94_08790 [Rickettsiales bacterium]